MSVGNRGSLSPRSAAASPGSVFSLGLVAQENRSPPKTNGFLDVDHQIRMGSASPCPSGKIKVERMDFYDGGLLPPCYDETDSLRRYIHVEVHPNGGASIVHLYQREFEHLPTVAKEQLARLFFEEAFAEGAAGIPRHVMGIVHEAATYLPELVSYFAENHPDLVVKVGHLRKKEVETTKMAEYAERVERSYACGTCRCGPLLQFSLVGQVSEEAGGYFPQFLGEGGGWVSGKEW